MWSFKDAEIEQVHQENQDFNDKGIYPVMYPVYQQPQKRVMKLLSGLTRHKSLFAGTEDRVCKMKGLDYL